MFPNLPVSGRFENFRKDKSYDIKKLEGWNGPYIFFDTNWARFQQEGKIEVEAAVFYGSFQAWKHKSCELQEEYH